MRLKASLLVLAAFGALGLAPGAGAQSLGRELVGNGSRLSLNKGRGTAAVHSRDGSLLGTINRGRIVVANRPAGGKTTVRFWGCEERRRPAPRTVVCIGRGLRVSVVNGSWVTTFKGRGVNASAVVEGQVRLRGKRGSFAIDGRTRSWPSTFRTYLLG